MGSPAGMRRSSGGSWIGVERLTLSNELVEFEVCVSGAEGVIGECRGVRRGGGGSSGNESCGGVGDDHISRGSRGVGEHFADCGGAVCGGDGAEFFDGAFGKTKVGSIPMLFADFVTADFEDQRGSPEGDFVELICTADDKAEVGAESGECLCEELCAGVTGGADDLMLSTGGVCERSQEVEECGEAKLAADRCSVPHGTVGQRCEAEGESDFVKTGACLLRCHADEYSELFEDISGAAGAGDAAIAVFGHRDSAGGSDNGRRSADVECVQAITAGATGIKEF